MIAEIQAQLRDADDTPFALIEGAVSLAQVKDRPTAMPAAFVIPLRAASTGNQRATGGVLQATAADIGVVIIFENLASPLGDPAADELESLTTWVRRRIIGMEIGENDPIEHIEGELVKARSGVVWWQETFGTSFLQEGIA
ncbi:phage tail terminator protein [Neorhizobium petrolearium]|uniref:phage tail terminator protein n=1 Tax=Neorhizobium petrolearium TaxID=515361 RepID=UPI003F7F91D4